MIIPHGLDLHWMWFLPVLYLVAPRTWVQGESVTANMMNSLRDLFYEIENGTAYQKKNTWDGLVTADLAGLVSAPGKAVIVYDNQQHAILQSRNGAPFEGMWNNVPFNATDFNVSSGTWSIITILAHRYRIVGRTMFFDIFISNSTLSQATQMLTITIPAGKASPIWWGGAARFAYADPALELLVGAALGDRIQIQRNDNQPIPAGTFAGMFSLIFEIT